MSSRLAGVVSRRGGPDYQFIDYGEDGADVFVHASSLPRSELLPTGTAVTFELATFRGKLCAIHVRTQDGPRASP